MSSEDLPTPGGGRRARLSNDNTELLRGPISSILSENEEKINNLDDIKTVTDWYKQGKHDPKKIPSIILNTIIEELGISINQEFINSLRDSISTKFHLLTEHDLAAQGEDIEFNYNFEPYVEFIKESDGKKVLPPIRITFGVQTIGKLEGARFNSSPTVSGEMVLNIERILLLLTISIVELKGSRLDVPIHLSSPELVVIRNTALTPKIMPKDS